MEAGREAARRNWRRTLAFALIGLGLSLTLNGYVSRDGDQAYRLPLLLHRQDPALFPRDPFVRALDQFNPHAHYLQLLDWASRPFGLSAGLFGLYAATFLITFVAVDSLARRVWPEASDWVGVVSAALLFTAKSGNIGTNHLFEPLLLDRMIALAFGWTALAMALGRSRRLQTCSAIPLGLAAWVHPSLGLQMGMWLAACWVAWGLAERRIWSILPAAGIALALAPGLAGMDSSRLFDGLPPEQFRLLSAYIQSPQHMIPHLWRTSQWDAALCFPVLALFSLRTFCRARHRGPSDAGVSGGIGPRWRMLQNQPSDGRDASRAGPTQKPGEARRRLLIALGLIVVGLIAGTVAIEVIGDLRVTLIQPFRMATLGRGICLVLLAPHLLTLLRRDSFMTQLRAAWLFVGLLGDWTLVAVTCVELSFLLAGWAETHRLSARMKMVGLGPPNEWLWPGVTILAGLLLLAWHDTESGHIRLLAAMVGVGAVRRLLRGRSFPLTTPRLVRIAGYCWMVPLAALILPSTHSRALQPASDFLAARCRFGETPTDDIERLALWCREHTAADAVFIGPPGPKTFRLWSGRSLAFNRAGSPYHAAGIADWAERFREHVAFEGTPEEFANAYLTDHQALERRYEQFTSQELADLAKRQEADHVITGSVRTPSASGPLELLHVEGRYAVYRVRVVVAARSAGTG